MNREIIFKSPAGVLRAGILSCLLALSFCVSGNQNLLAKDSSSQVKQKTVQESSAKSDKSDMADKSDKDKADKDKTDKDKTEKDKTEKDKTKKDEKGEKSDKDKKNEKADKKDAAKGKESAGKGPLHGAIENVVEVAPDDLIEKPHDYLGKNVKFTANFFSFSNLALDYKPAMRPAKTHLSILVSRSKKNKIPLSELKLAMMTPPEKDPETQMLGSLKEGDTLEITGKVFSTALDDPWVDILRLKKIGGSTDDKKADASAKAKINDTKATDSKNDKSSGAKSDGDSKPPAKN